MDTKGVNYVNIWVLLILILPQIAFCQDIISTIAGTGTNSYSGDNGAALSATLFGPQEVALDRSGTFTYT